MIGAHSRVSVPEVTWFYPRFRSYIHTYGPLSEGRNFPVLLEEMLFGIKRPFFGLAVNPRTVLDEVMAYVDEISFKGAFAAILNWHRAHSGKDRWGEKTPHSLFYLKEIFHDFPDAKVVLMYRDGRDVVCSQLRSCFGPTNVLAGALMWKRCMRESVEATRRYPADRLCALSYESLAADPVGSLQRVCQFIHEDFEPTMLDFYKGDLAVQRARAIDHRSLGEPVHERFVGIYREEMSRFDEGVFCAIAGDELREMGYTCDIPAQSVSDDWITKMIERDARCRAASLDAPGGHIVIESYADWVVDQREFRRKAGLWCGAPPHPPSLADWPQEQIEGFRAPRVFKDRFAVPRRYTASEWIL